MLLSGASTEAAALRRTKDAQLTYAGNCIEAVTEFKYLGVIFHCCKPIGESAAAGRAAAARFAAAQFDGRCAELGLEAARLLLQLFDTFVDATLSYAAAVWAVGPAAAAAAKPVVGAGSLSAAELQHLRFLRRLLGLPQATPTATLLAEAGQPPLYVSWLRRAARFWNSLLAAPQGSLMQQTLQASLALAADCDDVPETAQPWAAQLTRSMQLIGVAFDPQQQQQLDAAAMRTAALRHHLELVRLAAAKPEHTRVRHYFYAVRPDCLSPDAYELPAYICDVRERRCRRGLTELRTGMHWGSEETGRRSAVPRQLRQCPHCPAMGGPGGIEDVRHIVFDCPLYATERTRWPDLFANFSGASQHFSLCAFFQQPSSSLAPFCAACRQRGRAANGMPP